MNIGLPVLVWLYDYIFQPRNQMATRLYGWVGTCLTMKEVAELFSKVFLPFYVPTCSV